MVSVKPDLKPDGRYGMMEAARKLGVSYFTINNWISKGLLRCYMRPVNGRRFCLGSDLIAIWLMSV